MTNAHTTGATLRVEASANVHAPAADVYRTIADYRSSHPRIVPPEYVRNLRVLQGGYGEGTVIEFDVIAYGRTIHSRATINEPEPGRVLAERDLDTGSVTHFTVEPLDPSSSRVTIATDRAIEHGGVLGWVERAMTRSFLRGIYVKELARLSELVSPR